MAKTTTHFRRAGKDLDRAHQLLASAATYADLAIEGSLKAQEHHETMIEHHSEKLTDARKRFTAAKRLFESIP